MYFTFLRPFVVKHESEIDRQLNELTTRAGDLAFFWWHRSSGYIQAQFYQLLAYVASQSNRTQQGTDSRQIPQPSRQPPRPTSQIPHHDGPQVLSDSENSAMIIATKLSLFALDRIVNVLCIRTMISCNVPVS